MHDSPMLAVRQKTESSMVKAVMAVREGKADAVVSAGSTGALLAGGMLRIGRIRGVERPALAPVIPGRKKPFLLIDCGANVDCQARYLQQFGLMGAVYMQSVQGVARSGSRPCQHRHRGGKRRQAHPRGLRADVQTDGLRPSRATPRCATYPTATLTSWWPTALWGTSSSRPSRAFPASSWACSRTACAPRAAPRAGALMMRPALRGLKSKMDYKSHGGAPLLGVNGAVVKAHGSSDARGDQECRAAGALHAGRQSGGKDTGRP